MNETLVEYLPPQATLETNRVLKQLSRSHRALAELKGYADTIPNKNTLINAITINEAKDSSEIENVITTHNELFIAMSQEGYKNPAAKEVVNYRTALWKGYKLVKGNQMLTTNMIIDIQKIIVKNNAGVRKLSGTTLKNQSTVENVYTPPSGETKILKLMSNLEKYINEDFDNVDPLVKLAVIHFQFEAIHPFYDGNGRTGRIINVLYLVLKELLNSPTLYLSKFIIRNKTSYYKLLQEVRTENKWEEWVLFILEGIEQTSEETLKLVKKINAEVATTSEAIKKVLPKIYSKELVELLSFEFYTKIKFIQEGLDISRRTASDYLIALEREGFLSSKKLGREKVYLNKRLFEIVKESNIH